MRDRIVGLLILKPLRWKIGRTAPSVSGSSILFDCQNVERSPFPLRRLRPHRRQKARDYRTPGQSMAKRITQFTAFMNRARRRRRDMAEIPPGNENCLKSLCNPDSSRVTLG